MLKNNLDCLRGVLEGVKALKQFDPMPQPSRDTTLNSMETKLIQVITEEANDLQPQVASQRPDYVKLPDNKTHACETGETHIGDRCSPKDIVADFMDGVREQCENRIHRSPVDIPFITQDMLETAKKFEPAYEGDSNPAKNGDDLLKNYGGLPPILRPGGGEGGKHDPVATGSTGRDPNQVWIDEQITPDKSLTSQFMDRLREEGINTAIVHSEVFSFSPKPVEESYPPDHVMPSPATKTEPPSRKCEKCQIGLTGINLLQSWCSQCGRIEQLGCSPLIPAKQETEVIRCWGCNTDMRYTKAGGFVGAGPCVKTAIRGVTVRIAPCGKCGLPAAIEVVTGGNTVLLSRTRQGVSQ